MVYCCVPLCGSDSWTSDLNITFHEFPSNPDLAAKWIQQINIAIPSKPKPMWFPRGKSMICSKHFLQTDFKEDSDTLKPRVIPSVFGYKYIGVNENGIKQPTPTNEIKKSPLIVNLIRPTTQSASLSSTVCSDPLNPKDKNEHPKIIPSVPSYPKTYLIADVKKTSYTGTLQTKLRSVFEKSNQTISSPMIAYKGGGPYQSPLRFGSNISNFSSKSTHSPSNLASKFIKPNINSYVVNKRSPLMSKISSQKGNMIQKRKQKQKGKSSDLIEIGPNTFLKINPEIIKVNKKLTPSGNTVLQFVMDQKLANSQAAADLLPKIVHGSSAATSPQENGEIPKKNDPIDKQSEPNEMPNRSESVVQHVLGHLVDTHVCKDSCVDLKDAEDENDEILDSKMDTTSPTIASEDPVPSTSAASETKKTDNVAEKSKTIQNFLNKAPVLFTTNIPLSNCLMDKPKFLTQLKQKSRQIASMKFKIASLTKKVEELEDRCIVQERQLSYSFIKRLKTIHKNSSKGDSSATYILEQIRCYAGKNKMRWSDSTLSQCAVWCRKAPYAYEYFKKADFFKLPCLGTVKRFMKKHPELKFLNRSNASHPNDDESSSDFDFDESDSEKGGQDNSELEESADPSVTCEVVYSESNGVSTSVQSQEIAENHMIKPENVPNFAGQTSNNHAEGGTSVEQSEKLDKPDEITTFPMTVDSSSLEVQEIILPSGEVVQCYSSNICDGTEVGNQYYIIPNVDQTSVGDHEYNVVQATDSLPVILQNLENAQLPLQKDQLIFITNSADQLECTETEVITASM